MLQRVSLQHFKALADVETSLEPLTVFVGPNACGKSSLLEGIELLSRLGCPHPGEDTWPLGRPDLLFAGAPRRWQTNSLSDAGLFLRVESEQSAVSLFTNADEAQASRRYTVALPEESLEFRHGTLPERAHERLSAQPLLRWMGRAQKLQLDPGQLAAPAYSEEEVPTISPSGAGLAAVLAHLASTAPDALSAIAADLQAVVPITRRLRMPRAEVTLREHEIVTFGDQQVRRELKRAVWGNRLEVEVEGEGFIPAGQLSEGTLLILGLLATVHGPKPPHLLLIDDLERALHPDAQRELIGLLRRFLRERPGMQILCTSHSPYLLDSFEGSEVRVMRLNEHGNTVCRPLTDHPDWERFQDDLRPGEFWSTVSEQWVTAPS